MGKKVLEAKKMPAIIYKRIYENGVLIAYESNIGRIEKSKKGYFIPSFVGTDKEPYFIKLGEAQNALKEAYRIANNIPKPKIIEEHHKTGILIQFDYFGKTYIRRVIRQDVYYNNIYVKMSFFIKLNNHHFEMNGVFRLWGRDWVIQNPKLLEGNWFDEVEKTGWYLDDIKRLREKGYKGYEPY